MMHESISSVLLVLAGILFVAKIAGEVAERMGQPAVLGEMLAGVILGGSALGLVNPGSSAVHLMSELGVIVLLFAIGLETDLHKLTKVGTASLAVAICGVVLPFALGYGVAVAFGVAQLTALVIGAAMTATSVGITARVFGDLNQLQSAEGQIVLGAAVIDDILGLVILAIVANVVAGGSLTVASTLITTVKAFGFLILVVGIGKLVVPPIFQLLSRLGKPETLSPLALALAFAFAALAEASGSALIIGAFAAGLVLAPTPHAHEIEKGILRLGHFFVPIFFVAVGASVDITTFARPHVLLLGSALTIAAVAGKFLAGYSIVWFKGRKSVIGAGMIPRGEVGLIFAQMGLAQGVLVEGDFSAVMLMVMGTTFIAPVLLKKLLKKADGGPPSHESVLSELTTGS
jgi:Kef-type K+ transport system membrane component KefB